MLHLLKEFARHLGVLLPLKRVALRLGLFDSLRRLSRRRVDLRRHEVFASAEKIGVCPQDGPLPRTLPSGKPWPRISLVTPSFNQGHFIEETIQSVLGQRYPNVEHIVIDAVSSDMTGEILARYRDQIAHIVSEPDRGQSHALNKGFALATGEILCWLNSDDRLAPGALSAVALAFDTRACDLVSGICEIYDGDALITRHLTACAEGPLPLDDLLDLDNGWNAGQFFYQPEVFFTREMWLRAGGHVREELRYSMDYELWLRFAHLGARLHAIGRPLAQFRVHPAQKTADTAKFKAELIDARAGFLSRHALMAPASLRPPARLGKRMRVAFVNDLGSQYGAGIAHARVAAGFDMAGHDVEMFGLVDYVGAKGKSREQRLVTAVSSFGPDIVIFGNTHSADRESIRVLEDLSRAFRCFWVAHDFWLLTGRCAYPGSCTKYRSGCDHTCPTHTEYPQLAPERIHAAWRRKSSLLASGHGPVVLANSNWTRETTQAALSEWGAGDGASVHRISLGIPTTLFRPQDRQAARTRFGLPPHAFVIAFSASSVSEQRKGMTQLIDALEALELRDVVLLAIGNLDREIVVRGAKFVSVGYVDEPSTVAALLSAADLYVGPSTEETLGQVFLEAAACGTPSVGFAATGVVDAVIDGVTGLLVRPATGDALRQAIHELHANPQRCADMGGWASIFAQNEFSIEASFRTLFAALRSTGDIDRVGVPHRISLAPVPRSLAGAPARGWLGLRGVSAPEGPYPEMSIPFRFRWLQGPTSSILVTANSDGPHALRVQCRNRLFDRLRVKVTVNDVLAGEAELARDPERETEIKLLCRAKQGANVIEFNFDRWLEATVPEPRALALMVLRVELAWVGV